MKDEEKFEEKKKWILHAYMNKWRNGTRLYSMQAMILEYHAIYWAKLYEKNVNWKQNP